MTVIATVPAQVDTTHPGTAIIYDFEAGEALEAGDAVIVNSSGKVVKANGGAAGTAQVRGIALRKVSSGGGVSVLKEGYVAGYTVDGMSHDSPVYLSATAGKLDTAAAAVSVVCARVTAVPTSGGVKKLLYFSADWTRVWA